MTEVGATDTGASFSELEQVNLTQSWIEVSLDLIHGNDQKGSDFYKKISEMFKHKWEHSISHNHRRVYALIGETTSSATWQSFLRNIQKQQVLFISESKNKGHSRQ